MSQLTRRSFLTSAAALPLVSSLAYAGDPVHCYLDQSGTKFNGPIVLATLTCRDPQRHLANLAQLRRKHDFRHALSHVSTSRFKAPYAVAALRYLVEEQDIAYEASIYDSQLLVGTADERDLKYFAAVGRLVDQATRHHAGSTLHLENRSTTGSDVLLKDYVRTSHPDIAEIEDGRSVDNNLKQLTGFLAGTIGSEIRQVTSIIKGSLRNEARLLFGVASLTEIHTDRVRVSGR